MTLKPGSIPIDSKYKIAMKTTTTTTTTTTTKNGGEWIYRLDPWVHRATFAKQHALYEGHFGKIIINFKILVLKNIAAGGIKIYEAHVGISTPEPTIGSYKISLKMSCQ